MLKILAIGNSFSCDCTEHLYNICKAGNKDVKIGNLYIGGCSLERQAHNIENNIPDYEYFINALSQGSNFSANYAIDSDEWDIVTLQQASHFSGKEETYYPHIEYLCEYIHKRLPRAQIFLNQTWAYETDSHHSAFPDYNCDQKYMFEMLCKCYEKASQQMGAPMIPVGNIIQLLRSTDQFNYTKTGRSLCRDGFHLDFCYGRYAASAVWYEYLIGGDIRTNTFMPSVSPNGDSLPADEKLISVIKDCVHSYILTYVTKK